MIGLRSPFFLSIVTLLLWSFGGSFSRTMNLPGNAALYLITTLACLFAYQVMYRKQFGRWAVLSLSECASANAFFSSFGYGFYWLTLGLSMEHSRNASVPMAVNYTWPLFTALFFELFFRTKDLETAGTKKRAFIGMLIGFLGVAWLLLGNQDLSTATTPVGALLALMAGASYGIYGAYSSKVPQEQHLRFLNLSCFTGALVLIPWVISERHTLASLSAFHVAIAIAFGILVDGLGSYCWTKANRLVRESGTNITRITSLMLFLPFLSGLLLFLFFGEQEIFQKNYLLGLSLLLAGTALCNAKGESNRISS